MSSRSLSTSSVPARLLLLGPAFVAGIAYVDPGNVATNTAAGARYGYLLVWVLVAANLMAILIQYLSAKVGIATGTSLPRLCRDHFSRPVVRVLWVQAELVALATDLAEVVGGALALYILFDIPLPLGAVITGTVSFLLLTAQSRSRQQIYERVVIGLLAVIVIGFTWCLVTSSPDPRDALSGIVPRFEGHASVALAAAMLGATVMPHAIYLHSALVVDRFGDEFGGFAPKGALLRVTRYDVVIALAVAGSVNIAMLLTAASALSGLDSPSIEAAHRGLQQHLGAMTATFFAIALLASGISSSSVGTYAGSVILEGFTGRSIPLLVRRLITILPGILILQSGVDPTRALIASQVVLSLGIPFALFPLVKFTRNAGLMGELVNRTSTTVLAFFIAFLISGLNITLVALTFAG